MPPTRKSKSNNNILPAWPPRKMALPIGYGIPKSISGSVYKPVASGGTEFRPPKQVRSPLNGKSSLFRDPTATPSRSPRSPPETPPNADLELSRFNLPVKIVNAYRRAGVTTLFPWQAECLRHGKAWQGKNLVYSAPTSAGKTLVAEILLAKRVIETGKKGLFILPFVAVAREKMKNLQKLFEKTEIKVEGFFANLQPKNGLHNVRIAVCTIEKANSLINRMISEGTFDQVGVVIVDELHMVGDAQRGFLIELLLTKIQYLNNLRAAAVAESQPSQLQSGVQIIGMSATLPNLDLVAKWLSADLYITDYRPVPLYENVKLGSIIYNKKLERVRDVSSLCFGGKEDPDHVVSLCYETLQGGHSVVVFCPSKKWCESLADMIARAFFRLEENNREMVFGERNNFDQKNNLDQKTIFDQKNNLNQKTNFDQKNNFDQKTIFDQKNNLEQKRFLDFVDEKKTGEILSQLRQTPAGLDVVLARTLPFMVAFHHAGLTLDERDVIEASFKKGDIRVLVATTTLSCGINLPARRVIIRSPIFQGSVIDTLTYNQMAGRAGRKGVDTQGESILMCKDSEKHKVAALLASTLRPVKSCLVPSVGVTDASGGVVDTFEGVTDTPIFRAVLEIIVNGAVKSVTEVARYIECTLFATGQEYGASDSLTESIINALCKRELIILSSNGKSLLSSQLGNAFLWSSFSFKEAFSVLDELKNARMKFNLETELHILYLVTPLSLVHHLSCLDWFHYLMLWERLPPLWQSVGGVVGVEESLLTAAVKGSLGNEAHPDVMRQTTRLRRFYCALMLNELVNEVSLAVVAQKYQVNKGMLQSLQQGASSYAGMITVFCEELGWMTLQAVFAQFQNRLLFGVQNELTDIVRITFLTAKQARFFYQNGYKTILKIAAAKKDDITDVFIKSLPFSSSVNSGSNVATTSRKKILLNGVGAMEAEDAAALVVAEAFRLIDLEAAVEGFCLMKMETIPTAREGREGREGYKEPMMAVENVPVDFARADLKKLKLT